MYGVKDIDDCFTSFGFIVKAHPDPEESEVQSSSAKFSSPGPAMNTSAVNLGSDRKISRFESDMMINSPADLRTRHGTV